MEAVYLKHESPPDAETAFRLLFRGLSRDVRIDVLLPMLRDKLELSSGELKALLARPPRPLWSVPDVGQARRVQTALASLGCVTTYQEVLDGADWPSPVPLEIIDKFKLSLEAPGERHLAVALIVARPGAGTIALLNSDLAALAGSYGTGFEGAMLDSRHALIMGPADAREGVMALRYSLLQALPKHLGPASDWTLGLAIHPADGETTTALIAAAYRRAAEPTDEAMSAPMSAAAAEAENFPHSDPDRRALTQARGTAFAEVLAISTEQLAGALQQYEAPLQQEFLDRVWLRDERSQHLLDAMSREIDPGVAARGRTRLVGLGRQPRFVERLGQRRELRRHVTARLKQVDSLPALPNVVTQIIQRGKDPHTGANELSALIEKDPGLTGKLLKLVNSAFFGFNREINDVKHAVVILGADEVINLAMTLATARLFRVESNGCGFSTNELWSHATGVATIAKFMAARDGDIQPNAAYTAGLLHDLGRIFLLQQFASDYASVYTEARSLQLPLYEVEEDLFGLNHAQIGERLALAWNLPESLALAIGGHHHPDSSSGHAQMAAHIGLADRLHHLLLKPADNDQPLTVGHMRALNRNFADLTPESLALLADEIKPVLEKAAPLNAM